MKHSIDISQLFPAGCILLAEQLWEQAHCHPEVLPAPDERQVELYRRLDASERGDLPPALPWEDVDAWLGTL